jgi:hypothetical protein
METVYLVEAVEQLASFKIDDRNCELVNSTDYWICTADQILGRSAGGRCLVTPVTPYATDIRRGDKLWSWRCDDGAIVVASSEAHMKALSHGKVHVWQYDAHYWSLVDIIEPSKRAENVE